MGTKTVLSTDERLADDAWGPPEKAWGDVYLTCQGMVLPLAQYAPYHEGAMKEIKGQHLNTLGRAGDAELSCSVTIILLNAMIAPFPHVPFDIARLILETAAWEHRPTAYRLALVSKVVRRWIDPVLYYSVTLGTSSSFVAFHASIKLRNDNAFFSRAVKVLCIGDRKTGCFKYNMPVSKQIESRVAAVLDVCTGVRRLAIWLSHQLQDLSAITSRLRPTHMSILDLTDYDWDSRKACAEILPSSLTHLNLDCETYEQLEDIPWQEICAQCPHLAHIILSGNAMEYLISSVVEPHIPDLPDAIKMLGIFARVTSVVLIQRQLDFIIDASERIVVVAEDVILRGQARGLYVFEEEHKFDSEWGSWRGEDTWDVVEKGVADLKRKRLDKGNTGV